MIRSLGNEPNMRSKLGNFDYHLRWKRAKYEVEAGKLRLSFEMETGQI